MNGSTVTSSWLRDLDFLNERTYAVVPPNLVDFSTKNIKQYSDQNNDSQTHGKKDGLAGRGCEERCG